MGDGGELEAAAGPHHHALATRLLAVRQERRRVEPDEVEPKRQSTVNWNEDDKKTAVSLFVIKVGQYKFACILPPLSLHILRRCTYILIIYIKPLIIS